MIIKSFTAETAAAALKRVRREMGGEAIVLKTRQLSGGSENARVEVTACLENPNAFQSSEILGGRMKADAKTVAPKEQTKTRQESPQRHRFAIDTAAPETDDRFGALERKLDSLIKSVRSIRGFGDAVGFDEVRENLKDADLSDELTASIIAEAAVAEQSDPAEAAQAVLTKRLADLMEADLTFQPGDRVVFIGPAGGGKSTLMGKVAAQLTVQARQRVTLTTLDKSRLAAFDEVQRYAEVLETALVDPSTLESADDENADSITLIDAPAWPSTAEGRNELAAAIEQISPGCRVAVFSALMRSADALAVAETLKPLAPTHLAVSMTDLTDRLGGVVSVAEATGWKIAMVGDAPSGIGGIGRPDPAHTARLLLKAEVAGD